jgi:fluoride exporter
MSEPPLELPVDSDVDLHTPQHRSELQRRPRAVLAATAAGGAAGSLARYGVDLTFPTTTGGFPWSTFGINVSGCLLIGVLMVLITDVWPDRQLLRPLLGVGVLGGFTTFSFHVLEAHHLIEAGAWATALAYLAGTAVTAVLAALGGIAATRRLVRTPTVRVAS